MLDVVLIILLWAVTAILLIATLLPFSKMPFGLVRAGEFPREQIFMGSLLLAAAMPFVHSGDLAWLGSGILIAIALVQAFHVAKFTPIWRKQSASADAALRENTEGHVSVLASNVKLSNRDYDKLVQLTLKQGPDIMMAIEVDAAWIDALKTGLRDSYDHWIEVPLDSGYGLCLMSKLELRDSEVRELIVKEVPSIRTTVILRDGRKFRLYVVHPEPPIMSHDTKGRDSEIAEVGIEAEEDPLPAIVTGDLNDVAWSTTTRRFQRLSGLLDPRVGRGFYNTFSATMPWMRWPLDHLFHDPRFRLVEMSRLPKVGSDHFPMWFVLALTGTDSAETELEECEQEELDETEEMIAEERARDREAIGSDWEDED